MTAAVEEKVRLKCPECGRDLVEDDFGGQRCYNPQCLAIFALFGGRLVQIGFPLTVKGTKETGTSKEIEIDY